MKKKPHSIFLVSDTIKSNQMGQERKEKMKKREKIRKQRQKAN